MGVRAGGQGCAALEMRVLQEICQLGSLRGDSQIGCSVILLIPCLAAGDYWGGDWPGDPELALWVGHSGIVAVPVPRIRVDPCGFWDLGDHHHLQQRLGSVAFG